VLDSSVFIDAERKQWSVTDILLDIQKRYGDEELAISVMSAAELVHGVWRAQNPEVRARREGFVEDVFSRIPVRPVTLRIARIVGQVDAEGRSRGTVIPPVDLFIGSTALDLGFRMATHNARHFHLIPGLKVVSLE
jgi:tRNA(fMet)-specific endonuclease VapC